MEKQTQERINSLKSGNCGVDFVSFVYFLFLEANYEQDSFSKIIYCNCTIF